MSETKNSVVQKTYKSKDPILLAVDCIIFGFDNEGLKLLIFKRELEPLAGQWSLIGNFVNADEDVEEAAYKVLKETTGLDSLYVEQLHAFGSIDRDNGARVVSIAYWSLIKLKPEDKNFDVADHEARWVDINEVPELILDHNEMVNLAMGRLRERARFRPIGFELLPDKFTLPQLLNLYESIYQTQFDDRNFRRKILKTDLLIKLDEKDKSTSKRGALLYKFDYQQYDKLSKDGYLFEL